MFCTKYSSRKAKKNAHLLGCNMAYAMLNINKISLKEPRRSRNSSFENKVS